MSIGGIAAAAALAARKKNRQRDDKSTEFMKDDEQEDVEMKSITAAALGKFSRTAEMLMKCTAQNSRTIALCDKSIQA